MTQNGLKNILNMFLKSVTKTFFSRLPFNTLHIQTHTTYMEMGNKQPYGNNIIMLKMHSSITQK